MAAPRESVCTYRMAPATLLLLALLQEDVLLPGQAVDVVGSDERNTAEYLREADRVVERYRRIFDKPVSRGLILADGKQREALIRERMSKHGAKWYWTWIEKEGLEGAFGHEMAHLLLVFGYGNGKPRKEYGSLLPDWIDEGFAGMFDAQRQDAFFRKSIASAVKEGRTIPLETLFRMVHPESAGAAGPRADDRLLWYAQTASVFRFLEEVFGDAFIREAAAADCSRALGSLARPKGEAARTLGDLDALWKTWVRFESRIHLPAAEEAERLSKAGPVHELVVRDLLRPGLWIESIRDVEAKLGAFDPELSIHVSFSNWPGPHPAFGERDGERGIVRFNLERLVDLRGKREALEAQEKELRKQRKRMVWKIPPLRFDRLIPHELTHIAQDAYPSPAWLHEGLASWVAADEHYLFAFAQGGKAVAPVDDAPVEADDAYGRGLFFFRWLEQRIGAEGIRRFAAETIGGGEDWKSSLESISGISWKEILAEEQAWSAARAKRFVR